MSTFAVMFRKLYIFSHCGHAVLGPEAHRKTARTSAPSQGRSLSVDFTVPNNTKPEPTRNDEQPPSEPSHANEAPNTPIHGTAAVHLARSASPARDPATNNHNRENNSNSHSSSNHLSSSLSLSTSKSKCQDTTTIAAASQPAVKTHPFTSRRVEFLCPLCEAKRDELLAQWDRTHEVRIERWKWNVGRAMVQLKR